MAPLQAVVATSALTFMLLATPAYAQSLSDRLWALSHSWNGDDATFWLREEAYATAVNVALAKLDQRRGDPALIERDFTQVRFLPARVGDVPDFEPCSLPTANLTRHLSAGGADCTSSPGWGGVKHDGRCPEAFCILVSINETTWADPVDRRVILQVLNDHAGVCADARQYGPNRLFDAAAADCFRPTLHPVRLALEVKTRLRSPCVAVPLGTHGGYKTVCKNPTARLIELGHLPKP